MRVQSERQQHQYHQQQQHNVVYRQRNDNNSNDYQQYFDPENFLPAADNNLQKRPYVYERPPCNPEHSESFYQHHNRQALSSCDNQMRVQSRNPFPTRYYI